MPSSSANRQPTTPTLRDRRSVKELLDPLEKLAKGSKRLFSAKMDPIHLDGRSHSLPRYSFIGPGAGSEYLRLGIFAAIHGDEPAGASATVKFLETLENNPELARGYELFVFPVCNPTGYEDNTRWSSTGKDLNREFWIGTRQPEVRLIEQQLSGMAFNGLISLHTDDTSEGIYGFVRGATLTRYLLQPALHAAHTILPINCGKIIDSFEADNGIIEKGYQGVLSAPPGTHPAPFEIVFETPQNAPLDAQVEAHVICLLSILSEFRSLISVGANL